MWCKSQTAKSPSRCEMDELWMRIADNLSDRVSGPMRLRFARQPVMATLLAIGSGSKNAKTGKPPYFWSLTFHPYDPSRRGGMIKDGWQSIWKLCFVVLALDLIYQFMALPSFYLRQAIIVAFLLVIAPYLILRGAVARLASRLMTRRVA
jgi:hypothetical protein